MDDFNEEKEVDKVKSIFKKKNSERCKLRGWPYRR